MRFSNLDELKQYARNNLGDIDLADVRSKLINWLKRKRHAFANVEWSQIDNHQALRLIAAHWWIDEREGRKRGNVILVIPAAQLRQANDLAREINPLGGDSFTIGLSRTGDEPAEAYWCQWNMSHSEWEHIAGYFNDGSGRRAFDASKTPPQEVLRQLDLKVITPDLGLPEDPMIVHVMNPPE